MGDALSRPQTASTWIRSYTEASPDERRALCTRLEIESGRLGLGHSAVDAGIKLLFCRGDVKRAARRLRLTPAAVRFHRRRYLLNGIDLTPEKRPSKSKILREDSIRFLSFISEHLCLRTMSIARYSACGKLLKTLSSQEVDELYFAHLLSYASRQWRQPLTVGACRCLYRLAASIRPTNAETLFCFVYARVKPRVHTIRRLFSYLHTVIHDNWRKPREKEYQELLPAFLPRPDLSQTPPDTIRIDPRPIPTNQQLRLEISDVAAQCNIMSRRRTRFAPDRPPPDPPPRLSAN